MYCLFIISLVAITYMCIVIRRMYECLFDTSLYLSAVTLCIFILVYMCMYI